MPPLAHIARYDLILANFDDASRWIQRLREKRFDEDAELIEGQSDFLQERYQDARNQFEMLRDCTGPARADDPERAEYLKCPQRPKDKPGKPSDPLYHSYAYSLLARLYAEQGQYRAALDALEEGIEADVSTGDKVHQGDKILDRAYISFKRRAYDACLQDVELSLSTDRSLQRSLAAGTLLGQIYQDAPRQVKPQITAELRTIEARIPRDDFKPFSDAVRFHLRGERLLAEGSWKRALDAFVDAHKLEPAAKDEEYLGRARLALAQHIADPSQAAKLREEALDEYSTLVSKPGQVWQWPQAYFPGYYSDSTLQELRLSMEVRTPDTKFRNNLKGYLTRHVHADPALTDMDEAQVLLKDID
jgi:tetratricopeptide (TPR) repeat protein